MYNNRPVTISKKYLIFVIIENDSQKITSYIISR